VRIADLVTWASRKHQINNTLTEMDSIDPATAIGAVHLTISDLDRSIRFYQGQLGLTLRDRQAGLARLGAGGPDLLVLSQSDTARRVPGTSGLYHFAILVPSRLELARSLRRLVQTHTVMQGFADHGVSEALYLSDPDGNGIEVYRDRPRPEWPYSEGHLSMGVAPLDPDQLLGELNGRGESWGGLPGETTMGHVHLHVAHLPEAEAFYVGVLGFQVMQRYGSGALFVSAGGYHHHIGLNTWAGVGAPPAPPGAIGLRYFVVRLPAAQVRAAIVDRVRAAGIAADETDGGVLVHDPARNRLLLAVDPG
jgi:catechol 2,3-dioxygenase